MKKNVLSIGLAALLLGGCAGKYEFYPNAKAHPNATEISREEQKIVINGEHSSLEVVSLEERVGPWTAPRMQFTIKNNTENRIMNVQADNIQIGFNNFWFHVENYKIIKDNDPELPEFVNDDNFRMIHEVLPGQEIVIEAIFETPKSQEYYEKKDVLIEVYTNLGLFNVKYKIKKDLS